MGPILNQRPIRRYQRLLVGYLRIRSPSQRREMILEYTRLVVAVRGSSAQQGGRLRRKWSSGSDERFKGKAADAVIIFNIIFIMRIFRWATICGSSLQAAKHRDLEIAPTA